jgi:hypothetical protein
VRAKKIENKGLELVEKKNGYVREKNGVVY